VLPVALAMGCGVRTTRSEEEKPHSTQRKKINAGKMLPSEKLTLKLLKSGRHAPQ
jgi:hypothetical protein